MAINKIIIMGRLCADPELRRTNTGTPVTSFTLAVERNFRDKDGNSEADFIECIAWRSSAEFVCKHFNKGRMAIVEGSLQIRSYTDKDGNKRKAAEVLVERVYFGDSKAKAEEFCQQTPADLQNRLTELSEAESDYGLPF